MLPDCMDHRRNVPLTVTASTEIIEHFHRGRTEARCETTEEAGEGDLTIGTEEGGDGRAAVESEGCEHRDEELRQHRVLGPTLPPRPQPRRGRRHGPWTGARQGRPTRRGAIRHLRMPFRAQMEREPSTCD